MDYLEIYAAESYACKFCKELNYFSLVFPESIPNRLANSYELNEVLQWSLQLGQDIECHNCKKNNIVDAHGMVVDGAAYNFSCDCCGSTNYNTEDIPPEIIQCDCCESTFLSFYDGYSAAYWIACGIITEDFIERKYIQ